MLYPLYRFSILCLQEVDMISTALFHSVELSQMIPITILLSSLVTLGDPEPDDTVVWGGGSSDVL